MTRCQLLIWTLIQLQGALLIYPAIVTLLQCLHHVGGGRLIICHCIDSFLLLHGERSVLLSILLLTRLRREVLVVSRGTLLHVEKRVGGGLKLAACDLVAIWSFNLLVCRIDRKVLIKLEHVILFHVRAYLILRLVELVGLALVPWHAHHHVIDKVSFLLRATVIY